MEDIERRVGREVRAMTRREVIVKILARQLTWLQAAQVLGVTPRHLRRIRRGYQHSGISAVMDQRGGRPRRKRIKPGTVGLLIRLKRDVYADFSVRHFYEQVILLPFEIEPPIVQGQETAVRGSIALDREASRSFGNQSAQR